jgi:hypothetical protein
MHITHRMIAQHLKNGDLPQFLNYNNITELL